MSKAERRPDFSINIDDVLSSNVGIVEKAKSISSEAIPEVPFSPVSAEEIKYITDQVRSKLKSEDPVEKKNNLDLVKGLNNLKQSALSLVLVGEDGNLVPKGSEYFPKSRSLVIKAYEVKRLNNDGETISYRNDVLSHVLSTNPKSLSENLSLERKVRSVQKRYALLKEASE